MLINVFRAIEQRVVSISPQWFMTDDAEQYHNAWKEVFGESNTRKILCAWHVDRAWRKAAELMPKSNQCQVTIVKTDKEWAVQSQSQHNNYILHN